MCIAFDLLLLYRAIGQLLNPFLSFCLTVLLTYKGRFCVCRDPRMGLNSMLLIFFSFVRYPFPQAFTHCFWSFQICCSNECNILCTTLYGTLMLLVFLVVLHSAHTILYWPISEMLSSFHLDQRPFPLDKSQTLHHPE